MPDPGRTSRLRQGNPEDHLWRFTGHASAFTRCHHHGSGFEVTTLSDNDGHIALNLDSRRCGTTQPGPKSLPARIEREWDVVIPLPQRGHQMPAVIRSKPVPQSTESIDAKVGDRDCSPFFRGRRDVTYCWIERFGGS
jgi:hypothetical protein